MAKYYRESFGGIESKSFNKEKREIYDVVLLGKESRNNRAFSDEAMRQAATMLEGSTSYLNHREDLGVKRSSSHNAKDIIGYFEGVYFDGQKVRARTFKVTNTEHLNFVFDMVENHNKSIGFSIDWAGKAAIKNGKTTVQEFEHIRSADLVAEPASTTNFFESEETDKDEEMADKAVTLESLQKEYPDIFKEFGEKVTSPLKSELESLKVSYKKDKIEALKKERGIDKLPDWVEKVLVNETDDSKLESILDDYAGAGDGDMEYKKEASKGVSKDKKIKNPPKKMSGTESTLEADSKKWLLNNYS